jgi:hypothetical protein
MSLPPNNSATGSARSTATRHYVGPFVTRVVAQLADGSRLVATSRRHRKGLAPHLSAAHEDARIPVTQCEAWKHFWAPRRLAWWIPVSFIVGSACFALGGWAVTWPAETVATLRSAATANRIFFVGSLFFSIAAYLQLLEAANNDVAEALGSPRALWHWWGWKPHNLGWLASAFQLAGAVAFNVDTADAMIAGLSWEQEDLLVWTPNAIGSACFLISSALAWVELSHGAWSFAPRSASWWSVAVNAIGSAAFAVSALYSFVRPGLPDAQELWLSGFYTFVGALCFLVGSYLLIPELFDGKVREPTRDPTTGTPTESDLIHCA